MELLSFLNKINVHDDNAFKCLMAIFSIDIISWQKIIDKNIVKELNKGNYKLYDYNSKKWELSKQRIKKNIWKKSILYNMKKDEDLFLKDVKQYALTGEIGKSMEAILYKSKNCKG